MLSYPRRQLISTVLLVFSVLCCILVLLITSSKDYKSTIAFYAELRFFVIVCGICPVLLYWFDRPIVIIPVLVLHLSSVIIVVRLLGSQFAGPELIICLPFFLETAVYLELKPGILVNLMLWLIMLSSDFVSMSATGVDLRLDHLTLISVVVLCTAASASTLIHYREIIVSKNLRIDSLNDAVLHLSEANQAFQIYADHVESQSAMEERNRITRELHDTIGYALTNVTMSMNAGIVLAKKDPQKLDALFRNTKKQAEDALQETRQTLYRLRAVRAVNPIGLNALSRLTKAFEEASEVDVTLDYGNAPQTFGHRIDEVIYRLVQEGLTNAFRHGRASKVRVSIWLVDEEIRIAVWDNGRGAEVVDEGIGLSGMSERFHELGGEIQAINVPDGFKLTAHIPYRTYKAHG